MMKIYVPILLGCSALLASSAFANDRYASRPPVVVSPDLTAPWITQLNGQPARAPAYVGANGQVYRPQPRGRVIHPLFGPPVVEQATVRPSIPVIKSTLDPELLPQVVAYRTNEAPGTIIIDTDNRFLYLVMAGGKARRYGVGVGKPGFEWAGVHKITRKQEWPGWTPPREMIDREAAKGHYLPAHMEGGEANPLGARAMYLGSTLYRIHGTNAPWTIGNAVSSGCIRLRNEDVADLYDRVKVGTRVIVK